MLDRFYRLIQWLFYIDVDFKSDGLEPFDVRDKPGTSSMEDNLK
jgi:hypothetical protein